MRFTLLEIVQEILSSMDSDEVNSINDSVESYQLAILLKSVYYDCATELGLNEHETLFQLNSSGLTSKPTLMTVPENVTHIDWIRYDKRELAETTSVYEDIEFQEFTDFLISQQSLRSDTTGVGNLTFTTNSENFDVMYLSDRQPSKFTYLAQSGTILFDSYDSSIDSTLQKSKTACFGRLYPIFTLEDSFVPLLDPTQFSFYKNRAKVRAFAELKQVDNREAAGETQRQKSVLMNNKHRVNTGSEIYKVAARYGRK